MDETEIVKALTAQWPMVTVILLTFFRSARSAIAYLRDFERKIDSALAAQIEHGKRLEVGFSEIAHALRQGVVELRDRTARHSQILEAVQSNVSQVTGRVEALERSGTVRPSAAPQPLRPVQ